MRETSVESLKWESKMTRAASLGKFDKTGANYERQSSVESLKWESEMTRAASSGKF